MSIAQSCMLGTCEDGPPLNLMFGSSTSLSTAAIESDWCVSSCTDGLECSEDISFEEAGDDRMEEGDTLCEQQHLGSAHSGSLHPGVDAATCNLIRAELGLQREMYSGGKHVILKAAATSYGSALQQQQSPGDVVARPCWSRDQQQYITAGGSPCTGQRGLSSTTWMCDPSAAPSERVYSGWPESSLADRQLLVGWMMDLTRAAQLQRETLFLATSLLDRFLAESSGSTFEPPEQMLQLLAMACVSVAMKFEEVVPLHSGDLVRLAVDQTTGAPLYLGSDLGQMEWRLLWLVDWRARAPTPLSFLQHFLLCCNSTNGVAMGGGSDGAGLKSCRRQGSSKPGSGGRSGGGRFQIDGANQGYEGAAGGTSRNNLDENSLELWAHRILDLATLHHCDLVHHHSTVAIACLALAERAVTATATRGTTTADCAIWAATARRPCLVAVQVATGLSMEELAPNLSPCLALLERLCMMEQQVMLQPQQMWLQQQQPAQLPPQQPPQQPQSQEQEQAFWPQSREQAWSSQSPKLQEQQEVWPQQQSQPLPRSSQPQQQTLHKQLQAQEQQQAFWLQHPPHQPPPHQLLQQHWAMAVQ